MDKLKTFAAFALLLVTCGKSFAIDNLFVQTVNASHQHGQHLAPALQAILENTAVEKATMLNLKPAAVSAENDRITMELEKGKTVTALKFQSETKADGIVIWHGQFSDMRPHDMLRPNTHEVPVDSANSVLLVRHNDNITGTIRYRGQLYEIIPIGRGMHVLAEIDESKIPAGDDAVSITASSVAAAPPPHRSTLSVIRVMVILSNQAKENIVDVDGLVESALQLSNDSFVNSDIAIQFVSAGIFHVNYDEPTGEKPFLATIKRVHDKNDPILGYPVHALREANRADIVVILLNSTWLAGQAWLDATKDWAFAAVSHSYATTGTFAHEVGHLFGANHDPGNASPGRGYSYGYQQQAYGPHYWSTLMAYPTCKEVKCPRINYWSSPNHTYYGVAMGLPGINDNVRLLNERRDIVAGFYPPITGEPPSGQLEAPAEVDAGQSFTVKAIAADTAGSDLTYQWHAPSFDPSAGTTAELTLTAPILEQDMQKTITVDIGNEYGATTLSRDITIRKAGLLPTCATPWEPTRIYETPGIVVSFENRNYTSAHWTQNNQPVYDPDNDYGPWRHPVDCSDHHSY